LKDEDDNVRLAAIKHSNANAEHAAVASKDSNTFVSRVAKEKLAPMENAEPANKPKNTISLAGGKLRFNENVTNKKLSFKNFVKEEIINE